MSIPIQIACIHYIWQPYPEENSLNFPLWDGKGACLWGISVPAAPLRLASIEWAGAQPGITHTACSCLARHYPCPLHCYYLPCTAYAAALSFACQLWWEWESVWESEKGVCGQNNYTAFFTHWITQASIPNILQLLLSLEKNRWTSKYMYLIHWKIRNTLYQSTQSPHVSSHDDVCVRGEGGLDATQVNVSLSGNCRKCRLAEITRVDIQIAGTPQTLPDRLPTDSFLHFR